LAEIFDRWHSSVEEKEVLGLRKREALFPGFIIPPILPLQQGKNTSLAQHLPENEMQK
jgi:hypothetical protein